MNSRRGALVIAFALLIVVLPGQIQATNEVPTAGQSTVLPQLDHMKNLPEGFNSWAPGHFKVIPDGRFHPSYPYPYGYPWPPVYPYPPYAHPPYYWFPQYFEPEKRWYEEDLPIPAGRLMVLVTPVHAEVLIDGVPLQRHPDLTFEVGLLQGEYRVEAQAQGHESMQRTIEIKGGERIRLNFKLKPGSINNR
jgi:hypothetical protein